MKKILSVLLILPLLLCSVNVSFAEGSTRNFTSLSDPSLLQYIEDNLYAGLVDQFDSEGYIIENISAVYISQEYLDELAYKTNALTSLYKAITFTKDDMRRIVFNTGGKPECYFILKNMGTIKTSKCLSKATMVGVESLECDWDFIYEKT